MKELSLNRLRTLWQKWLPFAAIRFERQPIASFGDLVTFIKTRSAYIAQTSLYGYLKTRMGTRYTEIFQADAYVRSINISKNHTFVACMSDLTVFAAGLVFRSNELAGDDLRKFARALFERALDEAFGELDEEDIDLLLEKGREDFTKRTAKCDWDSIAEGESAFTESPRVLFETSPIADELKQFDEEIVTNSIRFRWRDVRDQLRRRLDCSQVFEDWRAPR